MQEYSVLGGKCPGESKKKLGGFCPWWKMSRRIEKKIGRKLSWEENIQENQKYIWEEYVTRIYCPGGYFPGGKCHFVSFGGKCLGRILYRRKIGEENMPGGK